MRPPKMVKPYVLSFCRGIVAEPAPKYVEVHPISGAAINNCFLTVSEYVKTNGGSQQLGWTIREWPKVMIEAEFHAVWVSPENVAIDITPKQIPIPRILFLPDSKRTYKGRQVDDIRKALCQDRDVSRFLVVCHALYLELNAGDLAERHGEVPLSLAGQKYLKEKTQLSEILFRRYGVPEPEPFVQNSQRQR